MWRRPQTHFWDAYDAHIALLRKNNFNQSAALLECYEQERKRQQTAIENLERQIITLVAEHANYVEKHGRFMKVMEQAGVDEQTMILTDIALGEPEL